MKQILKVIALMLIVLLTACAGMPRLVWETPAPAQPAAAATVGIPTATVEIPTPTSEPVALLTATPAFEALTYENLAAGYSFYYPKDWVLDSTLTNSRATSVQFTSWVHEVGQSPTKIPKGGTRLDVTVQQWDPKNDLQAFTDQRKSAWAASGITIVSEEQVFLSDGRAANQFVVKGADGVQSYFMFTTLGEAYLIFSGSGDLNLLGQIALSVR